MPLSVSKGNGFGEKTAAGGTKILRLIPPLGGNSTRINQFSYSCAGTAHTATILRSIGRTLITTAGLSGQANIILSADPGPAGNGIDAGDYVAIRTASDGITRLYVVSSWASVSRTLTLTTNLVVAVAPNDVLWDLGIESDIDPITGEAQQQYTLPASVVTTYAQADVGINASNNVYEPLLISVNNVSAAGTILTTVYTQTTP